MKRFSPLIRERKLAWAASVALAVFLLAGLSLACGQTPEESSGNPPPKKKRFSSTDKVKLEVSVAPKEVRRGQTFKLTIHGVPEEGWHTYPLLEQVADKPDNKSILSWDPLPPGLKPLGKLTESAAKYSDTDKMLEHEGPFTWSEEFAVLPEAAPGPVEIKLKVSLIACERYCLPPAETTLQASLVISAEEPTELSKQVKADLEKAAVVPPSAPSAPPTTGGGSGPGGDTDLLSFMLMGVFWGFVSLITPCVFPMIPITVSFFLKQSEKEHHKPITMALVYCATIIIVLTIAALALLSFFRALSTNPVMNFVIGGLFVFFALSLFGMYEIELPSFLARFTSAREGRRGLLGTVFMALTFTIISFACVAPFLGGFGGTAANSNLTTTHRLLGGLAFATTFASPFFVLALFPSLLKKLPKSGAWLNTVKVVMGFLELAAALKFLRAGELVVLSEPAFLTYDMVLGIYVALALLCGLYLLGVYRLPHDSPVEHLGVPRLLFSLAFLGLAFYLAPGLFKYGDKGQSQRPAGSVFAWLDSFILPDEKSDLPWIGTLDKGLAVARDQKKLVFVDFTGVTCNNCKLNEREVFSQPAVRSLLTRYALVQLYTDRVPPDLYNEEELKDGVSVTRQRADAKTNLQFQRDEFDTEQLPYYVVLEPLPDGKYRVLGRYEEGRINNQAAFKAFLRSRLELAQRASTQSAAAGQDNLVQPAVARR